MRKIDIVGSFPTYDLIRHCVMRISFCIYTPFLHLDFKKSNGRKYKLLCTDGQKKWVIEGTAPKNYNTYFSSEN